MVPCLCQNWWKMSGRIEVQCSRKSSRMAEILKLLSIKLFDHAKPSEFSFMSVIVSIMVDIPCYKPIHTYKVHYLHSLDHVDWEWQSSRPWSALAIILQVELG